MVPPYWHLPQHSGLSPALLYPLGRQLKINKGSGTMQQYFKFRSLPDLADCTQEGGKSMALKKKLMKPKIVTIAGKSNSGKTTLIEKLIDCMSSHGHRIGSVKQAHHGLKMDRKEIETRFLSS